MRPKITLACEVCKNRNHHQEEPPQRPRPAGTEEVLPELRQAPGTQRVPLTRWLFRRNWSGPTYRHPDYYLVEREKIREYAKAVQNFDPACLDDAAAAELGYPVSLPR